LLRVPLGSKIIKDIKGSKKLISSDFYHVAAEKN
jgi:hypothetical protein